MRSRLRGDTLLRGDRLSLFAVRRPTTWSDERKPKTKLDNAKRHQFVRLAGQFQSEVGVWCNGIVANGKSILDLLTLAAECGTMLALEARGCDAEDAVAALANLISAQSHESEDRNGEAS